jgi:hypothetical protein
MAHGFRSSVVSVNADVYVNCMHDIIIIIIIIMVGWWWWWWNEATGD